MVQTDLDARALAAEQVARARAMDPGERLREGPRLFDRAEALMKAGLRHRHPGASEEGILALLRRQLDAIQAADSRHDER